MRKKHAFSLIELLVVVSIIAILLGMLLPMLTRARRNSRMIKNSAQLRGIHQAMAMFAKDNDDWYPGANDEASAALITATTTMQPLLDNNYFAKEYIVSPAELGLGVTASDIADASDASRSFSYATLNPDGNDLVHGTAYVNDLAQEWQDTMNGRALLVSDRFLPTGESVWVVPGRPWEGGIAWGDNHVDYIEQVADVEAVYHRSPPFALSDTLMTHD